MSTVVCLTSTVCENMNLTEVNGVAIGMQCLTQGLKELNYAYEKEKEIENCHQEIIKVRLLITILEGKKIGVVENNGNVEFIVNDLNCEISKVAIKKIRQRYSKFAILHELESKGYAKVKEEKLANGKIRMVVEKWD